MAVKGNSNNFRLPDGVRCSKEPLPQGGFAYVFRCDTLGKLGRILVLPRGGQSHIVSEVAGDKNDPMTEKRLAVLQPITAALTGALENAYGEGSPAPPPVMQEPKERVKSKMLVCFTCDRPVALLVFSPNGGSAGGLEDTARIMYPKITELNVPTWITGEEITAGGYCTVLTLKIWPERKEMQRMLSTELDSAVHQLQKNHCQ